jgi:hypothetical protein
MNNSPFTLAAAACVATFAVGQSVVPTVRAQSISVPSYRVRVEWQKANLVAGGLTVCGKITNTGSEALTYTQVTPILVDAAGHSVYKVSGYLTVSPLLPGASAEFRASGPLPPRFAGVRTAFYESGQPVLIEPVIKETRARASL